jgi:hypothetical protein
MFEVNAIGPVTVTNAFLPLLKISHGRLVIVSSLAGMHIQNSNCVFWIKSFTSITSKSFWNQMYRTCDIISKWRKIKLYEYRERQLFSNDINKLERVYIFCNCENVKKSWHGLGYLKHKVILKFANIFRWLENGFFCLICVHCYFLKFLLRWTLGKGIWMYLSSVLLDFLKTSVKCLVRSYCYK